MGREHSWQGAFWACGKCSCLSGVFSLPVVWLLWLVDEHVGGSPFWVPAMPTLELIIPQMRDNVRSEVLATQTLISHLLYYAEEKAQP